MADIFDVDNQENYDIDPSFEPSEEDYLASLKKTDQDGVYPTGVHPSIKASHADDADDFYSMMSQQTWIPEQAKKSDWNPLDIFDEFKEANEVETHNMNFGPLTSRIEEDRQVLNDLIDIADSILGSPTNPSHYNEVPADLQHWDVVEKMGWGYHVGCATKYIWRAGKKASAHLTIEQKEIEDLEKAIVYLQKRIDLIKGDK